MKVSLRRIRLNQGGYTDWGRYFGNVSGTTFYEYYDDKMLGWVRATDREDAKRQLLYLYPSAKFYR